MLSQVQRHELIGVRDQIDGAMALLERVHDRHLRQAPHGVGLDRVFHQQLDGYVVGPISRALERFVQANVCGESFRNAAANVGHYDGSSAIIKYVLALGCVRAEIDRLLHDPEPAIEAAVEVAFAHLQRLLVVDDQLRARWAAAFDTDEEACERLGGAHLLQHGLWAFKSNAAGERSDLVLGQHVNAIDSRSLQAARGLVLTEWKRARATDTAAAIDARVADATKQLSAYAAGSLAAVDLRSVRYVVVVSEKQLPPRDDLVSVGYRVRYLNVAVVPVSPSKL